MSRRLREKLPPHFRAQHLSVFFWLVPRLPEELAREKIDQVLAFCGWEVQDYRRVNLGAARGVAVRGFKLRSGHGTADYLLYVDGRAVGAVEAKPEGATLTGVEVQSDKYAASLPDGIDAPVRPLPFAYQSTGVETRFTNGLDPQPRSRHVFAFHRPETVAKWIEQEPLWMPVIDGKLHPLSQKPASLRARLTVLPAVREEGLWPAQLTAVRHLEKSFADNRPRALIQMATGSGKTFTAISSIYRLIKEADASRVLFLVDRGNLGRQALKEFQSYRAPDDGRSFTELYNVQRLTSNHLDKVARVNICTIQRMYSMLKGEPETNDDLDETSAEETGRLDGSQRRTWGTVKRGFTRFQDGDIVFAKITPCMENGKAALAVGLHGGRAAGTTELHVLRPTHAIAGEYLLHYLLQRSTRSEAQRAMRGAAGQLRVPASHLAELPVPLPPLAEQHRIVATLEEHLTKLDAAVASLERARASAKRYRAAAMDGAVDGRLLGAATPASEVTTANGGHPGPAIAKGWTTARVEDLAELVDYGSSAKTSEDSRGVAVLRMGNVVEGELDTEQLKFLPRSHNEFPRLFLEDGDVLFNRTNSAELVGKSAVYRGNPKPASFASYLVRVRLGPRLAPDLLVAFLNSHYGRSWIRSVVSQQVGQANVSGGKLRTLEVPVPPKDVQGLLVAALMEGLGSARRLDFQLDLALSRAAALRQAVLKRAFDGKLVPQDPNDEPARAMLERLRSAANRNGGSPRATRAAAEKSKT